MTETVDIVVRVQVDIGHLAEQFAALTDDGQAQFFCEAAKRLGPVALGDQAFAIGRHLRTCSCSTHEGRELVRHIFESMTLFGSDV